MAAVAAVLAPALAQVPTANAVEGAIALSSMDVAYTQDFDTLAGSGTSSAVPTGWAFLETGLNANSVYTAGNGSLNTGDTYSFGSIGSTDRALGSLRSGNLVPLVGAQFTNSTGSTIRSLAISYTGEQWRTGATTVRPPDLLDFSLSTDATSLTTGTWTPSDELDFASPVTTPPSGSLDGNAAANRSAFSATISGVEIADGAGFWIRWSDYDVSGADDGLAVDDFALVPGATGTDAAPAVTATVPSDGATSSPKDDLGVTFSEPVDVSDGWFTLSCGGSTVPATVAGGPTTYTLNPDVDLTVGDSCTLTVLAAQVSDQDPRDPPDAMGADHTTTFTVTEPCQQSFTPAYQIQGSGPTSPLTGASVTTQGVVVGDYEGGATTLQGFFLQDLTGDGSTATSDGLFVYEPGGADRVSVGDVVRLSGTVSEYQGRQTEVTTSSVYVCGTGSMSPTDVELPFSSTDFPERYEGMLVRFPQSLTVTDTYSLGRYDEVLMSSGGRLPQPTDVAAPGAPALAVQHANELNQVLVDDATQVQNPDPVLFGRGGLPLSATNTLRAGDTAAGIVGVLTDSGPTSGPPIYRLRAPGSLGGSVPDFQPGNPRPVGAPTRAGDVRVMTLNLLNFFNTFTGCTSGLEGAATACRGASNQAEYDRQLPKIVDTIVGSDADVVGLVELENDGYGPASAIQALVDALNAASAPGTYAAVDVDARTGRTDSLGNDAVKVGLIYRPEVVVLSGTTAALSTTAFTYGGDSTVRNRPSLAQAFTTTGGGDTFVLNVNHLKSKGTPCFDPDAGDGQGDCNLVRTNAAHALTEWLATDPTGAADPDVLVTGDLNAYSNEDPITAIEGAGYENLLSGPGGYSYVFGGQWGSLDHALATSHLSGQVSLASHWHINADEPSALDYNTEFKTTNLQSTLYAPDRFRSGDHDPTIVDLVLTRPVLSFRSATRTALESAGVVQLVVERGGDTELATSVEYERSGGTADPADIGPATGTVHFAAGATTARIPISILDDSVAEGRETVALTLSDPAPGSALGDRTTMTLRIKPSDQQPDLSISTRATSQFLGNDVYNDTGAGQTKTVAARRTASRTFYVRVGNDGSIKNTFVVRGSAAPGASTVAYLAGADDITTAMRSAKGYRVTLAPGMTRTLEVEITVRAGAAIGSLKAATVTAEWKGDGTRLDLVKGVVKVVS